MPPAPAAISTFSWNGSSRPPAVLWPYKIQHRHRNTISNFSWWFFNKKNHYIIFNNNDLASIMYLFAMCDCSVLFIDNGLSWTKPVSRGRNRKLYALFNARKIFIILVKYFRIYENIRYSVRKKAILCLCNIVTIFNYCSKVFFQGFSRQPFGHNDASNHKVIVLIQTQHYKHLLYVCQEWHASVCLSRPHSYLSLCYSAIHWNISWCSPTIRTDQLNFRLNLLKFYSLRYISNL